MIQSHNISQPTAMPLLMSLPDPYGHLSSTCDFNPQFQIWKRAPWQATTLRKLIYSPKTISVFLGTRVVQSPPPLPSVPTWSTSAGWRFTSKSNLWESCLRQCFSLNTISPKSILTNKYSKNPPNKTNVKSTIPPNLWPFDFLRFSFSVLFQKKSNKHVGGDFNQFEKMLLKWDHFPR